MNRKKLTILAIFFLAIIICGAERHRVSAQGGRLPNNYTNQVFPWSQILVQLKLRVPPKFAG